MVQKLLQMSKFLEPKTLPLSKTLTNPPEYGLSSQNSVPSTTIRSQYTIGKMAINKRIGTIFEPIHTEQPPKICVKVAEEQHEISLEKTF